jgi:hypothetical protein
MGHTSFTILNSVNRRRESRLSEHAPTAGKFCEESCRTMMNHAVIF